ncbi:uncharacterized protein PAC_07060 [Phialocephala subalpina]|uniref:Uncharacterized protein n=1 Tax=Phialocephala subalpina TaxID=576137 RepID=A0A1L7WWM0_9HELO|nr:uncharacterized protein PAC_07060 [Phialocephala subalpina]
MHLPSEDAFDPGDFSSVLYYKRFPNLYQQPSLIEQAESKYRLPKSAIGPITTFTIFLCMAAIPISSSIHQVIQTREARVSLSTLLPPQNGAQPTYLPLPTPIPTTNIITPNFIPSESRHDLAPRGQKVVQKRELSGGQLAGVILIPLTFFGVLVAGSIFHTMSGGRETGSEHA